MKKNVKGSDRTDQSRAKASIRNLVKQAATQSMVRKVASTGPAALLKEWRMAGVRLSRWMQIVLSL
ncbi:hypothetical protein AB9P05_01475 [Roseivirga sp. BDSF3-8]|uniref:hypothetical protein n=1 Tax=Roseivirga sp. BDSF3-8 TaxID=3241598 RepID=UPI0035327672